MIKKYDKYKESGIEWAGKIPYDWKKVKLGRSFQNIGSGTTPNTGNDSYYENGNINWLNTGDLNDGYIYSTSKKISEVAFKEHSVLKLYPVDSIVIALYGATIGKLGHLKIETTTNQACCVISESKDVTNRYLYYFLLAAKEYIISKSYGGGQPNISQDTIKQLYIVTPTLTEQTQIANFLDHQTTIIDDLIGQKEKLITLLKEKRQAIINEAVTKGLNPNAKMKDSGIEWLGEIPEEWSLVKLKHLLADVPYSLKTGPFGSQLKNIDTVEEGPFVVYTQRNVIDNQFLEFKDYITQEKQETLSAFNVNEGDILLSTRGTIGKAALVPNNSPKGILHPCLIKLRLDNKKILNDWALLYINNSSYFIENVLLESDSTTIEVIYGNTLKEVFIPLPKSISIQFEILQYTNDKLNLFEDTISKEKDVIAKLKDYRQSLISESVTGKIDVRDWKPVNN